MCLILSLFLFHSGRKLSAPWEAEGNTSREKFCFLSGIARITKTLIPDPVSGKMVPFLLDVKIQDLKYSQKEDVWIWGGEGDIYKEPKIG